MSLKLGTTSIPGVRVIEDNGPASGGSADSGVLFIDYDGTELELWPSADVASKSALPDNPTHTGLTAQGWNWSLNDIKSYISSYPEAVVVVGQMYATTSGATEIDIKLDDANYLSPYLGLRVNGTVVIDWGDSSSTSTVTGTSLSTTKYTQHTYSSIGNYTISIKETSGSYALGPGSSGSATGTILTISNTNSNDGGYYRNKIINVRIGVGITTLYGNTFYYCASLKTVTLHSSFTTFSSTYQFYHCDNLSCVVVPNSVTSIPGYFVYNNWGINYISLPNSITSFAGSNPTYIVSHTPIKAFTIPSSLTSIPTYFLAYNYLIHTIVIPNNVTTISNNAFASTAIKNIKLNKVTTLSASIFTSDSSITSITIPNTVTSISDSAFKSMNGLRTIINNSNISSIAMATKSAWGSCYSLAEIPFSFTGTEIPEGFFSNCYSLQKFNLPANYTSIGKQAFSGCYGLGPSFTIPSTVTSIDTQAFLNCTGLREVHVLQSNPSNITLGTEAFKGTNSNLIIYVPRSSLSAYQSATNWSAYSSKMQEEPS